jgi:hypothetical protein
MYKTKVGQDYQEQGTINNAVLFTRVNDVFFRLKDNSIVVYVEKGFMSTETMPGSEEEIEKFNILSNTPMKYTEAEIKDMLAAEGLTFNGGGSNLLIAEMKTAIDEILKGLITTDSSKFFGVEIADWEAA